VGRDEKVASSRFKGSAEGEWQYFFNLILAFLIQIKPYWNTKFWNPVE